MKKLLTTAAVSLALLGSVSIAQADAMKIGIVDYLKVYQEAPQGADSVEGLKAALGPKVEGLQKQQKALEVKIETFRKNSATMTKKDMEEKQKTFTEDQQKFQQQVMAVRQDEMKKEQGLAESFQASLSTAIKKVGEKEGYSLILNAQAVPYTKFDANTIDATDEVVKLMKTEDVPAAESKKEAAGTT